MKKICRPLTLETVDFHRREECLHYEACLEQASALLWPSFSCDGCPNYIVTAADKMMSHDKEVSSLGWEV